MSQRNPMNDRYTTDEKRGQTRKSAAAAKPKTKAAATVRVQAPVKSKQEKKAAQKQERAKQSQVDRKYYNPPTAEYKKLRRLWWIMLVGAIVMTAFSWVSRGMFPDMVGYIALGLAYVMIIGALYIDFSKIRKVRRAYQEEMESKKTKEIRAMEKQARAAEAAKKKSEPEKLAEDAAPAKRGLFGNGFRLKNAEEKKAAKAAAEAAKAAKSAEGEAAKADAAASKDAKK